MKNILNYFDKFIVPLNIDKSSLIYTVLYLLISAIIPSHSFFFVLSFIYFVFLVYATGSIQKTIFYCFFPFWMLDVGRQFIYVAVPAIAISNPIYPLGRMISFTLSPFFVLSLTTIFILFTVIVRKIITKYANGFTNKEIFKNIYVIFFLATFACFFISSSTANFFPNLSLLYTTTEFSFLAWLVILSNYFRNSSKKNVYKMLRTFFFILFAMLIFESGITYIQFIKRGVIGLTVEKQTTIPTFGFGVDENSQSFRPIGLSYHANSLANWQIALLTTIVLLWLSIKDSFSKRISDFLIVSSSTLSVSVIVLTISRSAFLSLGVFISILLVFNNSPTYKALKFLLNYFNKIKIFILIVSVAFIYLISNRAYYSLFTFSGTGGFATRSAQAADALQLIAGSPIFGVGNGMYIPATYYYHPLGPVNYFPESIHQGFALFIAERGILPAITYLIGICYLIKEINKSNFSKTVKVTMIAGLFAVYTMMLFQPFINIMSLNILITCILLDTKSYAT